MTNGSNPTVHTDYLGMFVRESTGGSTSSLKYIITPEGRIKNTGTDAAPVWSWEYNLTDHLGNVRVVLRPHANPGYAYVDQQLNYFPFGMLMSETSSFSLLDNRYLYNGKELQTDFGLNWYDYGARFYDPAIGRTTTQDPMMEKFFGLSPYSMFANNPLRFIDPTGMEIEEGSKKEWEKQKDFVTKQRDRLQSKSGGLASRAEAKGWSSEKLARKQGNLGERVSSLNSSLGTMGTLESSSQVYSLSNAVPGEKGGLTLNTETNTINISFGGTANFVHETTHAGQFESRWGHIAFDSKTGGTLAQDVYDEVQAYRSQYAYDPSSVTGLGSTSRINSMHDILPQWVQGLAGGNYYVPGPGGANTGISPVYVNSTRADLMRAYPHLSLPNNYVLKTSYPTIYLKK